MSQIKDDLRVVTRKLGHVSLIYNEASQRFQAVLPDVTVDGSPVMAEGRTVTGVFRALCNQVMDGLGENKKICVKTPHYIWGTRFEKNSFYEWDNVRRDYTRIGYSVRQ